MKVRQSFFAEEDEVLKNVPLPTPNIFIAHCTSAKFLKNGCKIWFPAIYCEKKTVFFPGIP